MLQDSDRIPFNVCVVGVDVEGLDVVLLLAAPGGLKSMEKRNITHTL